jgi:hypothetical protein
MLVYAWSGWNPRLPRTSDGGPGSIHRFRRQDNSYHLQILSLQAHGQVTKSLSEILKSSEIKFLQVKCEKDWCFGIFLLILKIIIPTSDISHRFRKSLGIPPSSRAGVCYAIRRLDDRQHTKSVAAGFRRRGGTRKSPMVGRGWAQVQSEECILFLSTLIYVILYQPLSPCISSIPTNIFIISICFYQFLANTMLSVYRSSTSYVWTLLLRTLLHDWSQMWLWSKVGDQSGQSEGPWLRNRKTPRIPRLSPCIY